MTDEEKVFRMYELMHQRVLNGDRLLSERAGMLILISAILFAGFSTLATTAMDTLWETLLIVVLCVAGIFLSILLWSVNYIGIRELRVYINVCREYEMKEHAFAFLRHRQPERGGFISLDEWFCGRTVCGIAPITGWKRKVTFSLSSWNVYPLLIPALFAFLWTMSLITFLRGS